MPIILISNYQQVCIYIIAQYKIRMAVTYHWVLYMIKLKSM